MKQWWQLTIDDISFETCIVNFNCWTPLILDCESSLFCSVWSVTCDYLKGVLQVPVQVKRETALVSFTLASAKLPARGFAAWILTYAQYHTPSLIFAKKNCSLSTLIPIMTLASVNYNPTCNMLLISNILWTWAYDNTQKLLIVCSFILYSRIGILGGF